MGFFKKFKKKVKKVGRKFKKGAKKFSRFANKMSKNPLVQGAVSLIPGGSAVLQGVKHASGFVNKGINTAERISKRISNNPLVKGARGLTQVARGFAGSKVSPRNIQTMQSSNIQRSALNRGSAVIRKKPASKTTKAVATVGGLGVVGTLLAVLLKK